MASSVMPMILWFMMFLSVCVVVAGTASEGVKVRVWPNNVYGFVSTSLQRVYLVRCFLFCATSFVTG